mgnify:FL=1|tara:strand:- start:339 stop:755 length:417 start_codon:yes stop_codon:yes gene_type:complete
MDKKYKHTTTGQACNAGQYIAEMMCLREAESVNEGMPAHKLWNTSKWKNKYRGQVTKAYQLLRKYDERVIINALKTRAGLRIYSLRNKRLTALLKQEQEKFETESAREIQDVDYKDTSEAKPMRPYGSKSKLSKLRDE